MLEGHLPELVTQADIMCDLHVHTDATDGRSTLEQNRERAAELGYRYLAITDHAAGLPMTGCTQADFVEQWARIDALNEQGHAVHLLKGVELNIDDEGGVDFDEGFLARFDVCLASMHSGWGDASEKGTARVLNAMENPFVDVISHLTGRILGKRDPISLDIDAVLAKAAETGTLMEVDAFPDRLDIRDTYVRTGRRYGVRYCLGTDAHEARQMDYMPFGVAVLRRGWASPAEVLNAQPWDVARTWLKRSRTLQRPSTPKRPAVPKRSRAK